MLSRDFLRGRRQRELSPDELAALEGVFGEVKTVPPRTVVMERSKPVRQSTLLLDGFMCRYMDARDGQRQLVALHVAGDFTDLHGFPLQRLDHDIATLTECRIACAPHDRLTEVTERWPHLARLLWFSTLLDAAMHREWIFRMGRLAALGKVAHLLCETHARLNAIGRVAEGRFDLPLTQQDLGEACGLTSVHVNRMIAELRKRGLATVASRQATIHDLPGLQRIAEFESDYLYLEDEFRTP